MVSHFCDPVDGTSYTGELQKVFDDKGSVNVIALILHKWRCIGRSSMSLAIFR